MAGARVRHLIKAAWRRVRGRPFAPDTFDVAFYRQSNADLARHSSDKVLTRHYLQHGAVEGRPPNKAAALKLLEATHGVLPADFDPLTYQRLNPDIANRLPNPWAATLHYLRFGAREQRLYRVFDRELIKALNGFGRGVSASFVDAACEQRRDGTMILKTGEDFMRSRGVVGGGAWVERLDLLAFTSLNWDWAPAPASKTDAADLILAGGMERMAPLGFGLEFDPVFYRESHPDLANGTDQDLYRHWLFFGLERNSPGTAASRLAQIGLKLPKFPDAFDWKAYAREHHLPHVSRYDVLADLVAEGRSPNLEPDAASYTFLSALAVAFAEQDLPAAAVVADGVFKAGPNPIQLVVALGAYYERAERWAEAATTYRRMGDDDDVGAALQLKAARALLKDGDAGGAALIFMSATEILRSQAEFRTRLEEVAEALFSSALQDARAHLVSGDRTGADRLLLRSIDEIDELWRVADPIGAPMTPLNPPEIVILADHSLRQCVHYRVEQKLELLNALGLAVRIFKAHEVDGFRDALPGATAAIFYRVPATPKVLRAIDLARSLGVTTYYEVDDLLFSQEYPEPLSSYDVSLSEEDHRTLTLYAGLFHQAMVRCDYGLTSTATLAGHMALIVKSGQAFVVRNGLDSRNAQLDASDGERLHDSEDVLIFYGSGTKAHNQDFCDLVATALHEVLSSHEHARLILAGYVQLDERFDGFQDRIQQVGVIPDVRAYWSLLAETDINLAVLHPTTITNGKSEIKWLEAASLGIPSIVSATAAHLDNLEDGVDVLFAETSEQWRQQLTTLIDDAALRTKIGRAAQSTAQRVYGFDACVKQLAEALQPALTAARAARGGGSTTRKRRVLIANAFFPPDAVGGATRVVRENVDYMVSAADDIELSILASESCGETGRLSVDSYGETPVFRLSTQAEPQMDWRPFNSNLIQPLTRVLRICKPDLVHLHAAQRLTATLLEVCRDLGIPYVVTAHDAWWISDYQFLIDHEGRPVDPTDLLAGALPEGVNLGEALTRRRRLKSLLVEAQEVLSVSDAFADIYKRAGIPCRALPNGVNRADWRPRGHNATGKLRLAFAGGLAPHKGLHLLEGALRRSALDKVSLTVVDHAHDEGCVRREQWGGTVVEIVGRIPQAHMSAFYAQHDVLLAPSIWPESFGLVVREALAAGLWVVASNRGALAEDIYDGINGYVIDVSTPEHLQAILTLMNQHPHAFDAHPPRFPLRPADDQAAALLEIYREETGFDGGQGRANLRRKATGVPSIELIHHAS